MVEHTNADLAALLSLKEKEASVATADAMPELRFFTESAFDEPPRQDLASIIEESRPRLIAMECSPCELSTYIM